MINYSYIDYVNLMDLAISLHNFRSNNSQEERQKLEEHFNNKLNILLEKINRHLQQQDAKIDKILSRLEVNEDDS
jgi:hypothetical protein